MDQIVAAKVRQAAELMREAGLPLWIVQFGRETFDHPAPVQQLVVGTTVTWPAAFIITEAGDSVAIVGTGDVANVESVGVYDQVIGYVKDVGPPLRQVLDRYQPAAIGLSYSLDDDQADNLTHGMFLTLQDFLRDTPYLSRLTSASELLTELRARKLPVEVTRVRGAIDYTLGLIAEIEALLKPGVTEREVANAVDHRVEKDGLSMAWDARHDPIVNFGPNSAFGHVGPGDITLEPGMLAHVDIGAKWEGYCSDLQRVWYLLDEGENQAPVEVRNAFEVVVRSIQAGFQALRPGVQGWKVDAAAREIFTSAGFEEPQFAFGHQLGQSTHDGGGLLGPRWPRYGTRPEVPVRDGNIFTLEFGMRTPAGVLGIEEDVLVTADGAEYLSSPQTELRYLRF